MALATFSSRNVVVSYGGLEIEGFAPESSITLVRNSDVTDEEVGADGKLSISILPDLTGTVTLSLQKESPTNIALSGVLNTMLATGELLSLPFAITDPSGSMLAVAKNAHIKTAPEISSGTTATGVSYDWVFFCEELFFQSVPEGLGDIAAKANSLFSI